MYTSSVSIFRTEDKNGIRSKETNNLSRLSCAAGEEKAAADFPFPIDYVGWTVYVVLWLEASQKKWTE